MKKLLVLICFWIGLTGISQADYTKIDYFKLGDTLPFQVCKSESFDVGDSRSAIVFKGTGQVSIEADGIVIFIVPNGKQENVLRLRSVIKQVNILEQFNLETEISVITYVWYDLNHRSTILQVSKQSQHILMTKGSNIY